MGCQTQVTLGSNLTFTITTHDPDTGVLTDADSAPAYRVYEDETATAILTGTMTELDDANTTGFYSEQIACTTANGFEVDKSYNIYIAATVDAATGGISYGFGVQPTAATTADKIADHALRRSFSNAADSSDGDAKSFRSLLGAVAKLVNKIAISESTLTVYEDDDSTALGTQTLTTDSNAVPITVADTN